MKVCKNCNNLVNDEYNFCSECGCNEFVENSSEFDSDYLKESQEILQQRSVENGKKILIRIGVPFVLAAIIAIIGLNTMNILLVILGIGIGYIGLIGFKASRNTCPNCNSWNGLKVISKTEIGRHNTTIKEKRTATVHNLNPVLRNRTGETPQEIDYYTDVNAVEVHYDVEYKCEHCGYVTVRKGSSTYKN